MRIKYFNAHGVWSAEKQNKAPKSRKPKKQPLDNFDKETVRRVVHELYEKKQLPTLNKIRRRLQQLNINITRPRLSLELKSLGFKWKKITENRKIFIERPEIRAVRAHYLRTVRQFRRNGYQIVYLDETCVEYDSIAVLRNASFLFYFPVY